MGGWRKRAAGRPIRTRGCVVQQPPAYCLEPRARCPHPPPHALAHPNTRQHTPWQRRAKRTDIPYWRMRGWLEGTIATLESVVGGVPRREGRPEERQHKTV